MEWYVYLYDINAKKVIEYNIFSHYGFSKDFAGLLKSKPTKESFRESLRRILLYYFGSRCEYEITINGFPPDDRAIIKKVDIYMQVLMNYDAFVNFIWNQIQK